MPVIWISLFILLIAFLHQIDLYAGQCGDDRGRGGYQYDDIVVSFLRCHLGYRDDLGIGTVRYGEGVPGGILLSGDDP